MNRERWQQIEQLYHAALKRDEVERGAFLENACAGMTRCAVKSNRFFSVKKEPRVFWMRPQWRSRRRCSTKNQANL